MKNLLIGLTVGLLTAACSSSSPDAPRLQIKPLNDQKVYFQQTYNGDIDQNGSIDFSIRSLLLGDPILQQDSQVFYFKAGIGFQVPLGITDRSPVLSPQSAISNEGFTDYPWQTGAQFELARKVEPVVGTPFWSGDWQNAQHRYVALRFSRNSQTYLGWIELSVSQTDTAIILHRAAYSTTAVNQINTGD